MDDHSTFVLMRAAIFYEFRNGVRIFEAHKKLTKQFPDLNFRTLEFLFDKFENGSQDYLQEVILNEAVPNLMDLPLSIFVKICLNLNGRQRAVLRRVNTQFRDSINSLRIQYDKIAITETYETTKFDFIRGSQWTCTLYSDCSQNKTHVQTSGGICESDSSRTLLSSAQLKFELPTASSVDMFEIVFMDTPREQSETCRRELINLLESRPKKLNVKFLKLIKDSFATLIKFLEITQDVEKLEVFDRTENGELSNAEEEAQLQQFIQMDQWTSIKELVWLGDSCPLPLTSLLRLESFHAQTIKLTSEEMDQWEQTIKALPGKSYTFNRGRQRGPEFVQVSFEVIKPEGNQ